MKIWTETVNLADSVVSLTDTFPGGNYSLEESLFFDIETTGFKAEYCFIYMIGCATFAGSEATITLFFADTRSDEKAVLEAFGELLATKQQCFTFNGNHFDIPFIEKRCEKHGLDFRPSTMACFDLYLYAKQFKAMLQLDSLKQKSLEVYLGIDREDQYNGGELIQVYKDYETHQDEDALQLLKQHNLDDVRGMLQLLPLLHLGHLYRSDNYAVETFETSEREIILTGHLQKPVPQPISIHHETYFARFIGDSFQAILYPACRKLRYYYPNVKDYVYLIDEAMVIPKVLADAVPKDKKTKATKENCYVEKEGSFLRLPQNGILDTKVSHLFMEGPKEKLHFADVADLPQTSDFYITYLLHLMKE